MEPALRDIFQDALRGPGQLDHPGTDLLVNGTDAFLEESPLLRLEATDDAVIVANDEHHTFSKYAKVFAGLVDVACEMWNFESQPLPTPHFVE